MPTEINTGQAGLGKTTARNQGVSKSAVPESPVKQKVSASEVGKADSEGNAVVISETGQKLQSLEQSIRQEPEVRIEVVREIQKRVESRDFPIDVENLARQIIDQETDF